MTHTTLQGALEALYGLERRQGKLGLDGTRKLLAALGSPERTFRAVHVAGTNGKGSTCARIERALRLSGVRTGLFTSPHLVEFRERIRVNGRWADSAGLHAMLERIAVLPEAADRTFFEVATALGFGWFAEQHVEWAVVEVGLGGRLDTTNVLEPAVCAITRIGLDHTELLGDTLEAIAAEKAGIVKPGVPVVVAPDVDARSRAVIVAIAAERGAPVIEPEALGTAAAGDGGHSGAVGAAYQDANAATARAVLHVLSGLGVNVTPRALCEGLSHTRWPGRFEQAPGEPRLWWDGAHNADGMGALEQSWRAASLPEPAALVLALSRDKDLDAVIAVLSRFAGSAEVVATRSHSERALDPERIATAARAAGMRARVADDVAAACRAAVAATAPGGLVLLTGSLFAVGEAMQAFGGAPGELL